MIMRASVALVAGAISLAVPDVSASEAILGDWVYPDNGSIIRIYMCASSVCGRVIKVKDPSRRDINNPNPKLRNRTIVGVVLASNGVRTGDGGWIGDLYNPLDGNTYRGTLRLVNRSTLTVVGCFGGGLLCEAKTFKRAARRRAPPLAVSQAKTAGAVKAEGKVKREIRPGKGVKPATNATPVKKAAPAEKQDASLHRERSPAAAPTLEGRWFASER